MKELKIMKILNPNFSQINRVNLLNLWENQLPTNVE